MVLLAAMKIGEKIVEEVLKCKCCGEKLEVKEYGFKCLKCGHFYLLDDVEAWLDKYFTDEKVERESIVYDKGFEHGLQAVIEMINNYLKTSKGDGE